MATHSSVLAWRIPGTGGPGGLLSMGSHGVGHDWSDSAAAAVCWEPNINRGPHRSSYRQRVTDFFQKQLNAASLFSKREKKGVERYRLKTQTAKRKGNVKRHNQRETRKCAFLYTSAGISLCHNCSPEYTGFFLTVILSCWAQIRL